MWKQLKWDLNKLKLGIHCIDLEKTFDQAKRAFKQQQTDLTNIIISAFWLTKDKWTSPAQNRFWTHYQQGLIGIWARISNNLAYLRMIHIFISCVRNTPGSKLDSGLLWSSKTQCGHFKVTEWRQPIKTTQQFVNICFIPASSQFHPSFIHPTSSSHHGPFQARHLLISHSFEHVVEALGSLVLDRLDLLEPARSQKYPVIKRKKTWKIMGKSWKKTSINGGVCLGKSSNCCWGDFQHVTDDTGG